MIANTLRINFPTLILNACKRPVIGRDRTVDSGIKLRYAVATKARTWGDCQAYRLLASGLSWRHQVFPAG